MILVNYHSRPQLDQCLNSLYSDKLSPDFQVIVVDNSSDLDQRELARQYPDLIVTRNSQNTGFAAGCNQGALIAQGETLVFLNPDTIVEPGWLTPLLTALENEDQAGLVTPNILLFERKEQINAAGNNIHITGLTLCRLAGRQRCLAVSEEVSAISGAAFAIPRALFAQLGGFDADFFLYVEDTDLSWRARLAGYRCLVVPDSIVYHDYQLRFQPNKTYFQERNRHLTLLKNLHWASLLMLTPIFFLGEVITWVYVLLHQRQQWQEKWEAYRWIARHWGMIRKKRTLVQAMRHCQDRHLLRLHTTRLEFEQTGASLTARLAHLIFDPLFWILRALALVLIRW